MHAPTHDPPSIERCQICCRKLVLDTIAPHVLRGCEIQTFRCSQCGSVKSKIVSTRPPLGDAALQAL